MTTHRLKIWPAYFAAILDGRKRFELRRDDGRGFKVGDVLVLLEWDAQADTYTGRSTRRRVTYLLRGAFGLPPDLVVMSLDAPDQEPQP